MTRAPADANSSAIAFPRLSPPPVISATLPSTLTHRLLLCLGDGPMIAFVRDDDITNAALKAGQ